MLTLEEAQARLLALAPETYTYTLGLSHVGCNDYLAKDVIAQRTQPAADLSAMDGYAICGTGPWERVGESRAGTPYDGTLAPGQCTRISTGAHMPDGADSVLIQENASVEGAKVTLASGEHLPEAGCHVRRAGFDFAKGDTVLTGGTRLTPAAAALAVAAGCTTVSMTSRPSVAVLDSGDELVPVGEAVGKHQIPASNGIMLSWMLQPHTGLVDTMLGPVPDDRSALAAALAKANECHILITSGGASVGDHDLIQQALMDWGAELDFWKVAIKPGKPLMVATKQHDWGRQVILGLPGNPVSSFVTALLFALPLIRKSKGAAEPLPQRMHAIAGEPLPPVGSRREFLRGRLTDGIVTPVSSQDSSALAALAFANCLIERPENSRAVGKGDPVRIYPLENG